MKKFLLSCFLALGLGANAQVLLHESFENGATAFPGFTTTSLSNFTLTGSTCESTLGTQALGRAVSSTAATAVLEYNSGTASNGKKIDISVNYQQWGTTVAGNIKLEYAVGTSTTFVAVPGSTTVTFSTQQNCMVISGTIPEGTVGAGVAVKIRATTTRTNGSFTALYDAINVVQEVTAVPACTTYILPANAATNVSVRPTITWGAAAGAEYYKIKIGTSAGASNTLNLQVTGTSFTPKSSAVLPANTLLYASITPTNALGDAVGCASEISFTTGANPYAPYCGPINSSAPAATYPISSVAFAGATNTSSSAPGVAAHEDFTSTIFELMPNSSNAITIVGTGLGTNRFATVVFIDWNNNESFEDAGEKYFTASPFLYGFAATNTLTGSIGVPASALLDTNLRMRIKYNFVGAANPTTLPGFMTNPCLDLGNGQAEDYTVIVKTPTAAPACSVISAPADLSTTFASNGTIIWDASPGATGYKLYIGTTAGGTDVLNGTVVTANSYQVSLTPFTQYFAKVVPYNSIGDAASCTEISFTTVGVVYCAAGATSFGTGLEHIARVQFANIDNASTQLVSYQDFTTITGSIRRDGVYSATVTVGNADLDQTIVWIDYNQDGTFAEDEKVILTGTALATGSITIPPTAKLGDTRMRVRTHYLSALPNATSCGNSGWGQVEDYTVNIDVSLATVNTNKNMVAVYPNPFSDVLKISDVKGVKSVSINDVTGRLVKNMKPTAELNVTDLKAGLYIVTLNMEDGSSKTIKAIKK